MESRPGIKPVFSSFDKALELTGIVLLAILWGLSIYAYAKLPDIIPTHFNATGEADALGGKTTLLILSIVATVLYAGLTALGGFPHIFNYVRPITEANAQRQYSIATRLLRVLKVVIVFIFSLIILFVYLTTIGIMHGPGFWFLPLTASLVFIPVIVSIVQSLKKQ